MIFRIWQSRAALKSRYHNNNTNGVATLSLAVLRSPGQKTALGNALRPDQSNTATVFQLLGKLSARTLAAKVTEIHP